VEVNTTLLNQWFWNPETSKVKSLNEIIDVYYNSVGNNGVLLLNVSPDRSGKVPEDQIERLMQLKKFIDLTFCNNLACGGVVTASVESPSHKADFILDDDKMTYWTTDGEWDINNSSASLVIELGQNKTFDNVMVQEFIREGQRIAEWSFDIWDGEKWVEKVRYKTIGYKNIKRFKKVTTDKVRLNILRSWDNPMISYFGLYLSVIPEEASIKEDVTETGGEPAALENEKLMKGIRYTCFKGGVQSAALLDSLSFGNEEAGIIESICTYPAGSSVDYSIIYEGYIKIPFDGTYTFSLESADGSIMFIGGKRLLDNDEPHDIKAVEKRINLYKGYYPIKIYYTSFRNKGHLKVRWRGPGFDMEEITSDSLFHINRNL